MEVELDIGSETVGVSSVGVSQVLCSMVGTNTCFAVGPIAPFDRKAV